MKTQKILFQRVRQKTDTENVEGGSEEARQLPNIKLVKEANTQTDIIQLSPNKAPTPTEENTCIQAVYNPGGTSDVTAFSKGRVENSVTQTAQVEKPATTQPKILHFAGQTSTDRQVTKSSERWALSSTGQVVNLRQNTQSTQETQTLQQQNDAVKVAGKVSFSEKLQKEQKERKSNLSVSELPVNRDQSVLSVPLHLSELAEQNLPAKTTKSERTGAEKKETSESFNR